VRENRPVAAGSRELGLQQHLRLRTRQALEPDGSTPASARIRSLILVRTLKLDDCNLDARRRAKLNQWFERSPHAVLTRPVAGVNGEYDVKALERQHTKRTLKAGPGV
jgi:hypothetical protein